MSSAMPKSISKGTDTDIVEEDEDRSDTFGYAIMPYLVEDGGIVAVVRQIFGFEEQDRPELYDNTGYDEDDAAEDIAHFAHRVGDCQNTRPYHSLDDGSDCKHEV